MEMDEDGGRVAVGRRASRHACLEGEGSARGAVYLGEGEAGTDAWAGAAVRRGPGDRFRGTASPKIQHRRIVLLGVSDKTLCKLYRTAPT